MAPEVGTEAPDFTLKDQNNQEVTLSSFRGDRNVLVVFYPFAFSGICTERAVRGARRPRGRSRTPTCRSWPSRSTTPTR